MVTGFESAWGVLAGGVACALLFALSVKSAFSPLSPPWLYAVLWWSAPLVGRALYAASASTVDYPRYRWDMATWAIGGSYAWAWFSALLAAHWIRDGFSVALPQRFYLAGTIAAAVEAIFWYRAFWAEVIGAYRRERLSRLDLKKFA